MGATSSKYESSADPALLYSEGVAAGQSDAQGLVILDFGRPAVDGSVPGTIDYAGNFLALSDIATGVENYLLGYYQYAPTYTNLFVAIGTSDSCGAGQPCDGVICGCAYEPPDYSAWGADLADTVEGVQAWANSYAASGFTDAVTVAAGDDAEPAYDPGYWNTYDMLAGYAAAVGGYTPAMIDYGSAESGFWTEAQLLQVANGFLPDVLFPEVYFPGHLGEWTALLNYAQTQGVNVTVFGVLTQTVGYDPSDGYASLLASIFPVTGQSSIRWLSEIG